MTSKLGLRCQGAGDCMRVRIGTVAPRVALDGKDCPLCRRSLVNQYAPRQVCLVTVEQFGVRST
jgi:hypothetical protein